MIGFKLADFLLLSSFSLQMYAVFMKGEWDNPVKDKEAGV